MDATAGAALTLTWDLPATALADGLATRCRFPAPGTAVRCGVSGGADSLALVLLATRAGLAVTAVHVDHGLRPDAHGEAEAVAAVAAACGAAFVAERVQVAAGPNLEARARRARRAVLGVGALTGHTADDRAEWVLLALTRGTGLDGVGAMRPDTMPLLGLRRSETAALCAAVGLIPLVDPMNRDRRFTRVRMRTEVLPLLAEVTGRDPVPLLDRFARLAADDVAVLDDLAAGLDPTDARALAAAPVALARRALRRWLTPASGHPPDAASIERVLAVVRGEALGAEVAGGRRVRRTGGRLRIEPT